MSLATSWPLLALWLSASAVVSTHQMYDDSLGFSVSGMEALLITRMQWTFLLLRSRPRQPAIDNGSPSSLPCSILTWISCIPSPRYACQNLQTSTCCNIHYSMILSQIMRERFHWKAQEAAAHSGASNCTLHVIWCVHRPAGRQWLTAFRS